MPKWRKFHLKTLDSQDINDMPDDFTRLMWAYLPLVLDSSGRGLDNPTWLRSKVFPMRQDVSDEKVEQAMVWYAARSMVQRYEVGGRRYFLVPTWEEYQGKGEREALSVIPDPVNKPHKNKASQVKSKSRLTQDRGPNWSSTEVDVEEELDVEVDVEESQGACAPSPLPPPAEVFEKNGGKWPAGKLVDGTTKKDAAIQFIVEHVPNNPDDLSFWGQVVFAYQKQWSPKSYTVMVNDYFLRRRLPGGQSVTPNGHKAAPTGSSNLRAYVEAQRAKSG
jgi:hypothetical protein